MKIANFSSHPTQLLIPTEFYSLEGKSIFLRKEKKLTESKWREYNWVISFIAALYFEWKEVFSGLKSYFDDKIVMEWSTFWKLYWKIVNIDVK